MDALPTELHTIIWKARFWHLGLAVARCVVYTKEWRDARLCCKQSAATGKSTALFFSPADVFIKSLDLKTKLLLPTRAQQVAAMVEVREINGQRHTALFKGPCRSESPMEVIIRKQKTEIDLAQGTLTVLCRELNVMMQCPWTDEHIKLIITAFALSNANELSWHPRCVNGFTYFDTHLSPANLMRHIRSSLLVAGKL